MDLKLNNLAKLSKKVGEATPFSFYRQYKISTH